MSVAGDYGGGDGGGDYGGGDGTFTPNMQFRDMQRTHSLTGGGDFGGGDF
jgi:hypothetical protein